MPEMCVPSAPASISEMMVSSALVCRDIDRITAAAAAGAAKTADAGFEVVDQCLDMHGVKQAAKASPWCLRPIQVRGDDCLHVSLAIECASCGPRSLCTKAVGVSGS